MLKTFVFMQILINSSCSDLTFVQLLESHLHFLAQILLKSYSDLFALLILVDLRIFLLKFYSDI